MGRFDRIPEALRYAVYALAKRKHTYIVNICGPRERKRGKAAAFQVIPATYLFDDGDLGLTIHLPFDPESSDPRHLRRFLAMRGSNAFDQLSLDGMPVFVLRLGYNVKRAAQWIRHVLNQVYKYPEDAAIECEVYDQGLME